jgi:hypothetical protein
LEQVCGVKVSLWPDRADTAVLGLTGRLPDLVRLAAAADLGQAPGWHVTPVPGRG